MAFNNGPKLVTQGLDLLVDAADPISYPGSGNSWRDLRSTITGSLTGSVSYTSSFYGGFTFANSSSAIIFPGSVMNYGTSSFTVELAFRPTFINGRHYLLAKNSGSFPNWSVYLSGSNGSGKLFSEFNISSTFSCSYSSSTTFTTGSNYQVDVRILPALSASGIYVNGQTEGGTFGNGGGSLTTTSSLFVGNYSQNNPQNFSGSIYSIKSYTVNSISQPSVNLNAVTSRFNITKVTQGAINFELLVVAGGGGGGGNVGGGGGAGGLQYFSSFIPNAGGNTVIVGAGGGGGSSPATQGSNGQNSSINTIISIGGGGGGSQANPGRDGGSGGGGGATIPTPTSSFGLGTSGQGNNGGFGAASFINNGTGGGGGGAGSFGFTSSGSKVSPTYQAPNGGSGSFIASFSTIGGSPAGWFAGGGGGAAQGAQGYNGYGGIGGGGIGEDQATILSTTGSANTGGGGGGGYSFAAKAGGSGIVAIRYNGAPIALGGEITQSGGFTYHVYRTVGTSSFTVF